MQPSWADMSLGGVQPASAGDQAATPADVGTGPSLASVSGLSAANQPAAPAPELTAAQLTMLQTLAQAFGQQVGQANPQHSQPVPGHVPETAQFAGELLAGAACR